MNVRDKKLKWIDPILRPISRSAQNVFGVCRTGTSAVDACHKGDEGGGGCYDGGTAYGCFYGTSATVP